MLPALPPLRQKVTLATDLVLSLIYFLCFLYTAYSSLLLVVFLLDFAFVLHLPVHNCTPFCQQSIHELAEIVHLYYQIKNVFLIYTRTREEKTHSTKHTTTHYRIIL